MCSARELGSRANHLPPDVSPAGRGLAAQVPTRTRSTGRLTRCLVRARWRGNGGGSALARTNYPIFFRQNPAAALQARPMRSIRTRVSGYGWHRSAHPLTCRSGPRCRSPGPRRTAAPWSCSRGGCCHAPASLRRALGNARRLLLGHALVAERFVHVRLLDFRAMVLAWHISSPFVPPRANERAQRNFHERDRKGIR